MALSPLYASASVLRITPSVTASLLYSDNVNLSSTAANASFVTSITPGVKIKSTGGRAAFDVGYNLDAQLYSNSASGNSLSHQLSLSGNVELLEDRLMLLLASRMSRQSTSLTGASGGNANLSSGLGGASSSYYDTSNRSTVRSLSVQPVWRTRFGADAQVEASWQSTLTLTEAEATGTTARNSGNNLTLSLSSGQRFLRTPWSLRYTSQKSGGAGSSSRIYSLSGTIGYQPSPRTRYSLTFGQDGSNAATSDLSALDGPYWNLGVFWSPSSRISLEASAGRRRGSTSFGLNSTYRHRRYALALRYNETVQDSYAEVTTTEAYDLYTCPGVSAPVPVAAGAGAPAAGCTLVLAAAQVQVASLGSALSLSKSWSGNASYNLGNSLITIALTSTRRDLVGNAISGDSDESTSLSGAWSLRLGPRMGSVLSLSRSRAESAGAESEDTALGWTLTRRLAPDATGAIDLRHMQRGSGSSTGGYSENSISTRINMNF